MEPESVLDVGCGLGTLVYKLKREGIEAVGVDFADVFKKLCEEDFFIQADAKKLPFKDNSLDVVFSSDFFEHIPEEDINTVYNEMKRVGKRVVAEIACDTGGKLRRHQQAYHLTHKPKDWWVDKLPGIIFTDPELLELGSGSRPHKGYLTVDLCEDADIVGDFRQMHFNDVGTIRAHHLLEHFGRDEGITVLKLWHEWLRKGGRLIIETPDFEKICENFAKDKYWMARHAYGSQEADWAYHKDAWYGEKFEKVLPDVGFEVISMKPRITRGYLPNIIVTAQK